MKKLNIDYSRVTDDMKILHFGPGPFRKRLLRAFLFYCSMCAVFAAMIALPFVIHFLFSWIGWCSFTCIVNAPWLYVILYFLVSFWLFTNICGIFYCRGRKAAGPDDNTQHNG